MKKVIIIVGLLIAFFVLSLFLQSNENKNLLSGKYNAIIKIKNYGEIKVELDADSAPITVTNFVNLAKSNYYQGTTFHRIIEGFMMQGGAGIETKTIKGEFLANGYNNPIKHERGVISMTRAEDYNSASSQFFIMHQTSSELDGQYAAFGHVTSGMEIVDKICEEADKSDDNGIQPSDKRPIIESITIEE